MKITQLAILFSSIYQLVASDLITSCETLPDEYVETTAYSTSSGTGYVNGVQMVVVYELYSSVTYESGCGSAPSAAITTKPFFK
ncbi:hypothetical protein TPHA_0F00650 [Tetrapisispora phaffii CBS 4417]|uniref:Uncharacterized protein n=1 Tax=Tetrapisispora phaffii (strain ATCC 24235 / CBS 4417 / NBRC 1672 / NRRL Y-8282 / UCD 70-5) TaxID=1071381 RepID=G8BUW9_TETPH|nr:hypothetical protein TPHA_0F00650 [Tetrapisispora phaffii CBS 4417]CCE63551.1 hypothetical protein TPHA_0F00650 [Tetrapisispora phaffii CBS 4417]